MKNEYTKSKMILFFLFMLIIALLGCDDPGTSEEQDPRVPVEIVTESGSNPAYEGPEPYYSKVNVFNKDLLLPGYAEFRIPALVTTKQGTLLAFCEMRADGDLDPKTIVYRRSTDNGQTWGPVTLIEEQTVTKIYGNETVVVDQQTGNIHIIYLQVFVNSSENTCNMYHRVSEDDGVSWSERTMVSNVVNAAWRPAGPGTAIQLERGAHAGRLLIPGRYTDGDKKGNFAIYSDDGGETWQPGYKSQSTSVGSENETTCVELVGETGGESRVYVNSRNESSETGNVFRRLEAYSEDNGESLTGNFQQNNFIKTDNCQGSLFRWSAEDQGDDSNRILFSCVSWATEDVSTSAQNRRRHVGVWSTFDETDSWTPIAKRLHDIKGGYSSITRTQDGFIGVLFEEGETNYFNETSLVKINESFLDVPLTGARWDFEERTPGEGINSGERLDDTYKNGNARNIEAVGTLSAIAASDLFKQQTAIEFDGSSYLALSDPDTWTQFDFHENASFTVELVLKAGQSAGGTFLIGRPHQSTWPQWYLRIESDGTASFRIDDDEEFSFVKSAGSILDDRWHHVAAVRDRDSKKIKIYIDGELEGETSDAVKGSLANRRPLYIGGTEGSGSKFKGQVDFVRISPMVMEKFFE